MIKPIRFNIQAWGEREVSVTRLPALSQSALVIKALAVRELGGESKLLKLRPNEELAHSDLTSKAPEEELCQANARRGVMDSNIVFECQY